MRSKDAIGLSIKFKYGIETNYFMLSLHTHVHKGLYCMSSKKSSRDLKIIVIRTPPLLTLNKLYSIIWIVLKRK